MPRFMLNKMFQIEPQCMLKGLHKMVQALFWFVGGSFQARFLSLLLFPPPDPLYTPAIWLKDAAVICVLRSGGGGIFVNMLPYITEYPTHFNGYYLIICTHFIPALC